MNRISLFLRLAALAGLVAAAASTASAQNTQVYFDFGDPARTTTQGAAPNNDPLRVWNNFTSVAEGANIPNALDITGAPTGFSLFTLSRFNTFNTNGTTVSPVFPANATADSFVGNIETFGGLSNIIPVVQLTGLIPNVAYSFTFFASRTGVSDNRETRYSLVGSNSAFGDLNASNNVSNTVTVPGLLADAQGQITLTMTAGPNNNNANHFTYLGVMIVNYTVVPEPGTVAMLGFAGLCGLALVRRRRMMLARVTPVAVVAAAALAVAGTASADQIMINYGGTSSGFWNNATNPAASASYGSLTNLISFASGAQTGISMTIPAANHFGDPANHQGPTTVTGAAAAAGFSGATLDSFYGSTNSFNGSSSNPRVTFSGLDLNTTYAFTIFAGRIGAAGDIRTGLYTLIGGTTVSGVLNASENSSQVLALAGIRPDASGQIVLSIVRDSTNTNTSGFTYLNALRIDTAAVPEPTTWALLATGALALAAVRRRPATVRK